MAVEGWHDGPCRRDLWIIGSSAMSTPPPMFSDNRDGEKFSALEDDPDPRLRMYVFRWDHINKRRITPSVCKGPMVPGILGRLRDEFGGGAFNIMVRRGETIELSELVYVAPPPTNAVAFAAFKAKYGW